MNPYRIPYKERPKIRKRIEEIIKNPLVTLEDIAKGQCPYNNCQLIDEVNHMYTNPERGKHLHTDYSDGFRKQARKMLQDRAIEK